MQMHTIELLSNERIRQEAVRNGCSPIWSDDYHAWCCGCDDELRHLPRIAT